MTEQTERVALSKVTLRTTHVFGFPFLQNFLN